MIDFNALAQAGIRSLRAYDPGHDLVALRRQAAQPLLELGSNENPYGASRLAKQAIIAALDGAHVYPDPLAAQLLRRNDGGAATGERVEHDIAGVAACLYDALEQGQGLLSRVSHSLCGLGRQRGDVRNHG